MIEDYQRDLAIYALTYMILNGKMDYLNTQTLAYLLEESER